MTLRTGLLLVVHHVEARKSTNTSRLLARMVPAARVVLRGEPGADPRPGARGRRLVLFPGQDAREIAPADAGPDLLLVVPDGNWNQAGRMLRRDPDLAGAEVVRVPGGGASRYGLRRSPRPDTLCTLEAVARALGVLEGEAVEAELLRGFELFVERARLVRESGKGRTP